MRSFSFSSTEAAFQKAADDMKKLPQEPDTDTQLKIYGLYKQATKGDAEGPGPSSIDIIGQTKFDAWKDFKGLSKVGLSSKLLMIGIFRKTRRSSTPS